MYDPEAFASKMKDADVWWKERPLALRRMVVGVQGVKVDLTRDNDKDGGMGRWIDFTGGVDG